MGPGRTAKAFGKRSQIADFIRALNANDEVWFPEEAIEADDTLQALDPPDAEEVLVRHSDAVILLTVVDPLASGVLAEAHQFLGRADLRAKFFLVSPEEHRSLRRKGGPFAFSRMSRLESDQTFSYNAGQLKDCTGIRRSIAKWLVGMRYEKREREGA